jgi:uncharacterized protein YjiS (DUF1127 family)
LSEEIAMTDVLSFVRGSRAPRPQPLRLLLQGVAMRRSRLRLGELDDHLLRDIGLSRGEAGREAEQLTWDAPDHWLR